MTKDCKAHAKLNLTLDITGKRENGYHDISSVMQTIELSDDIRISSEPSGVNTVSISCSNEKDYPNIKWDESNLVYKAAVLMNDFAQARLGISHSISVDVTKNIPDGAGMGGGSSDAATVILALNEMLGILLPPDELKKISIPLGADIPFCLTGGTAVCEGIGEIVKSLPSAPKLFCVLIKPDFSISTGDMYRLTDETPDIPHPDTKALAEAIVANNINGIFTCCGNYMETAAGRLHPEIFDYKRMLTDSGAGISLMTGSGSTVYGLFRDETGAKKAFESIDAPKAKKFISSFC